VRWFLIVGIVSDVLFAGLSIEGMVLGLININGWLTVAISAAFLLGAVYFLATVKDTTIRR
jgi:hypothetical protein